MFGIGKSKAKRKESDLPAVKPFEDEPDTWKNYSETEHVRAWYELEALAKGETPPAGIPDGQEPFPFCFDEAHKGNRCAQYALGMMYLTGTLIRKSTLQANIWLSQAMEQGSPFACYELAKMRFLGIGFEKDAESAGRLYQKAYESFTQIERRTPNQAVEKILAAVCRTGTVPDSREAVSWEPPAKQNRPTEPARRTQPEKEEPVPQPAPKPIVSTAEPHDAVAQDGIRMREIPVEYVFPSPDNKYAAQDTEQSVHALALSIQVHGLINPLTLRRISDKEYRIIAGEKRFQAITKYLNWDTVPAVVKENLSDNDAQLMLNAANLHVRQYTAAQKLQFYMDYARRLKKKGSGELTGSMQQEISELLGLSSHQIRKYQRIVEMLPARKLRQIKAGKLSIERAYKMTFSSRVDERSQSGRASDSEQKADVLEGLKAECSPIGKDIRGTSENVPGRTSEFRKETDVRDGPKAGPNPALPDVPGAPENVLGRTSEFRQETDALDEPKAGPNPALSDVPGTSENVPGRTSGFGQKEDALDEPKAGLNPVPLDVPGTSENVPGRTSESKEAADAYYADPQSYREAVQMLVRLPTVPGESCAVLCDGIIKIGQVYRMEVYKDSLLISVLVDDLRRPYPASAIGRTLFLGSDSYRLAEEAMTSSS